LWGYIPPNVLGNLEKIPSTKANSTNAIYGIDGSPVVKDIYFDDTPNDSTDNPRWRTVLLGGLGAGGKGLYAIDITDVNNPTHLFAISNDESNKAIQHWDIDGLKQEFGYAGGSSIDAKYDYRKLGETWSTPRIIRIKVSGKDKWVAVFGGGYNGAVNPNVGSAVFVMDLEDEGRLLKVIDIVDTSADIVNSLPADLSVITADGTSKANYNGAMIYATDLEGKVTKINLTDKGTLYQSTTLFTAESTSANGRYIYTRPEVTINNDNNLWLYFGTGSTQKLQAQSSQIKNRLYGIKDKNFPNFATVSSPENVSKCKTAPTCPGGTDLGWYVDLKKSQKLTAEPTVDKDRVYFPIYEPDTTSACKTGNAILTGYDSKCGNSVLNVNMGKGVLSKVVKQGDNLYIGLAGEVNTCKSSYTCINFTS
jgi:type IV pilus assembly protein PilY1